MGGRAERLVEGGLVTFAGSPLRLYPGPKQDNLRRMTNRREGGRWKLVRLAGLEPALSGSGGRRFIH